MSAALERLHAAQSKADVRAIIDQFGQDEFRAAWSQLDPLTRATLLLARTFDGSIIQDVDLDGL